MRHGSPGGQETAKSLHLNQTMEFLTPADQKKSKYLSVAWRHNFFTLLTKMGFFQRHASMNRIYVALQAARWKCFRHATGTVNSKAIDTVGVPRICTHELNVEATSACIIFGTLTCCLCWWQYLYISFIHGHFDFKLLIPAL